MSIDIETEVGAPTREAANVQAIKAQRRGTRKLRLFEPALIRMAAKQSFVMLDPREMARNPVMFLVEVGTALTAIVMVQSIAQRAAIGVIVYQASLTILLLLTTLFANFASALAEARGKAQADSLRATRADTSAFKIRELGATEGEVVSSTTLRAGDLIAVEAGQVIPTDGEVVEGLASVDESAITGESAPVIREAGGDHSGVTGGTRVLSDRVVIKVTAEPGQSFLDKMIALVEGASRQKTPNEIALTIVLSAFSLIFLIVTASLYPMARYFDLTLQIPTLDGAVGLPDPDDHRSACSRRSGSRGWTGPWPRTSSPRAARPSRSPETSTPCLLDKTGTITIGNRRATQFVPLGGASQPRDVGAGRRACLPWPTRTPEGQEHPRPGPPASRPSRRRGPFDGARFIEFTAQTRMSGVDLPDGPRGSAKGRPTPSPSTSEEVGGNHPRRLPGRPSTPSPHRARRPLAVAEDDSRIVGVVKLEDISQTWHLRAVPRGSARWACGW